jgi:PhnB protein
MAYTTLVPMFTVSDPKATIAWFERLGFQSQGAATTPDGTIMHAELSNGPVRVMLGPAWDGQPAAAGGLSLYIALDGGIDAYYEQVRQAGITIAEPIQDQFWGDRTFTVAHPDGYRIMFAQQVRRVSMEEVQQYLAQAAPA